MDKTALVKLAAALLMFGVAGYSAFRWLRQDTAVSEKVFFYDLSEGKLFAGPRTAVPPIKGLNDALPDAVRAVVISTNGNPADKSSWKIAYLEMYSPELKSQIEAAQAAGTSPAMGGRLAQAHRFVRRMSDPQWFSLSSPEGEQIVNEWLTAGPGGGPAVVCTP
jgi:hypothetical protein